MFNSFFFKGQSVDQLLLKLVQAGSFFRFGHIDQEVCNKLPNPVKVGEAR